MNYRHGFHAGNFADVIKHAVLVAVLRALTAKDKPLCYVDSHAGAGRYDLLDPAAQRSGEFRSGILRVYGDPPAGSAPYVDLVRRLNGPGEPRYYPGSPWLAAALCRPQDRLILIERHPDAARDLGRLLRGDDRVHCHEGDGYERLKALLPPPERRGLVLIDPPFEVPDEFVRLARLVPAGYALWPQACWMVWYPIKDQTAVRGFHRTVVEAGVKRVDAISLTVRRPEREGKLTACGLLIVNLPFAARGPLAELLPPLATRLADGAGAGHRFDSLVGE